MYALELWPSSAMFFLATCLCMFRADFTDCKISSFNARSAALARSTRAVTVCWSCWYSSISRSCTGNKWFSDEKLVEWSSGTLIQKVSRAALFPQEKQGPDCLFAAVPHQPLCGSSCAVRWGWPSAASLLLDPSQPAALHVLLLPPDSKTRIILESLWYEYSSFQEILQINPK